MAVGHVAGISDEEKFVSLCRECPDALCHKKAIGMPGPALANLMWGGREHPLYQNLSAAMRMLLGRGRPLYRKLILGMGDPRDSSAALSGNAILLAQPTTGQIQAQLPPPRADMTDRVAVVFTTERQDVRRAQELIVSRSQYLACARLRKEVCYAFADVEVSEQNALDCLPESGVPECFVREACDMQEARFFKPSMDGPASRRDPGSAAPAPVDAKAEDDAEDEPASSHEGSDAESDVKSGLPFNENLLGLDESHGNDPLRQSRTWQKRMQVLQEEGDKLVRRQSRYHADRQEEQEKPQHQQQSDALNVAIQGGVEQCRQYLLDVKDIAKEMIKDEAHHDVDTAGFMAKISKADPEDANRQTADVAMMSEKVLERRQSQTSGAGEPRPGAGEPSVQPFSRGEEQMGTNVQAGKALSMLSHIAWVLSFVEFFYGDCAPMQTRPEKLSFEQIFAYLLQREELQYALASDVTPYKARPMSRWDTPEFVMVFSSALRSLNMLRASKFAIFGQGCRSLQTGLGCYCQCENGRLRASANV